MAFDIKLIIWGLVMVGLAVTIIYAIVQFFKRK